MISVIYIYSFSWDPSDTNFKSNFSICENFLYSYNLQTRIVQVSGTQFKVEGYHLQYTQNSEIWIEINARGPSTEAVYIERPI